MSRRQEKEVLRALPHADGQAPTEEHVEQVLHFMCDLKAEALADHNMPRAAKLFIHGLLNHLCCTLEKKKKKQNKNNYNNKKGFLLLTIWIRLQEY